MATTIGQYVKKEQSEIEHIEQNIELLRDKLIEKYPSHFSKRDIINTFFGALLIGFTFILSGGLVQTAEHLTQRHALFIGIATMIILTSEIYWIGYSRVSLAERRHRGFSQFWFKRFVTLYGIAIIVSVALVHIFGIDQFFSSQQGVFNVVILLSMPCAVGAAIPHLLKKY